MVIQIYLTHTTCCLCFVSGTKNFPFVTVKRSNILNLGSHGSPPIEGDGKPHCCVATISEVCSPWPDLAETPLLNCDLILLVDGLAFRVPSLDENLVGFADVSVHGTFISGSFPGH